MKKLSLVQNVFRSMQQYILHLKVLWIKSKGGLSFFIAYF